MLDELIDRYGDVPASVAGLVDISLVRVTAARAGVYEIGQKRDALLLYSDGYTLPRIKAATAALPGRITVNTSAKPYLAVRLAPGDDPPGSPARGAGGAGARPEGQGRAE